MAQERLICHKCNRELEPAVVNLEYLGHRMTYQLPRCPGCGLTYISEDVVVNKIQSAEMELEDK
jgi:uncharacterized protein with PIN domain